MEPRDLLPDAADWPPGLNDLEDGFFLEAPRACGELPAVDRPAVAIVGSRECSAQARDFAWRLAQELAAAGVVIWSGGAKGIDRAAHEGALDAGGATVAVLGGGIARRSPPVNLDLFERILDEGSALVSPFADDVAAARPGYFHRNRLLAAATQALVVVECRIASGARNAAAAARGLGRPVGIVPFAPWDEVGAGNRLELTKNGGLPIVSARDVLAMLGRTPIAVVGPRPAPRSERAAGGEGRFKRAAQRPVPRAVEIVDPLAREIFALLMTAPLQVDEIHARTGRSASEVSRALFELAVEGLARDAGAGNWRIVSG